MNKMILILILFLNVSIFGNETLEPNHSLYEVKVLKSSRAILTFEEIEDIKFFMIRNDLYEVWLKSSNGKWRRFWRPRKCSCESSQNI